MGNTQACAAAAAGDTPACGKEACCARSCKVAAFAVTSCDAGSKLKTGDAYDTTLCSGKAFALNCDKTLCCDAGTGATCDDATKGAKAAGFCGPNMEYDKTKDKNKCKAASDGKCVAKDPTDVHACCKKTATKSTNNSSDTSASNALTAITAVLVTVGLNH